MICSSGAREVGRTDARPASALDDDLQQAVAVEVRGEGLPRAPQRFLQARALLVELLEAVRQLARHLVELLAQRGELVVAVGGDLDAEVAGAEAAGGDQEGLDLALQRARHEQREGDREDEEADEDAGREPATAGHRVGLHGLGGEHRDARAGAVEALRADEGGGVVVVVADGELALAARHGRRIDALDGRCEHAAAGLHDDDLALGDARGCARVVRRRLDRDLERPEGLVGGVLEKRGCREDRGLVADIDEGAAVVDDCDARRVLASEQRIRAILQRVAVALAQGLGEQLIAPDDPGRAARRIATLLVEVDRRVVVRVQSRRRLRVLIAVDQDEEHDRDRHHRDDHDEHEEERQPVAEAHGLGRRLAAPAASGAAARPERGLHSLASPGL